MKPKICHISTVHSTYDTRIYYKECRTLAKEGYDVSLIINGDKLETIEQVNIIPISKNGGRLYRFLKKRKIALNKAINLDADIYHFHDPELIPVGKKLKKMGKKIIYDVHEDVPKQILTKDWIKGNLLKKIISCSFNIYEKRASKNLDKVITVSEEIAQKFKHASVEVVKNYPVISNIDKIKPKDNYDNNTLTVIYAGGLTKIRGIKEIIEAVGLLDGKVKLWLMGPWETNDYKKTCEKLLGWKYVEYYGVLPQDETYSYMKSADLGIVNFWPLDNHINSLPNKAFEYMACGLPMIMSDFSYWQNVFKGCFIGVNPKNPEDIASKMEEFIKNKSLLHELGYKGRKMILNNYSWEAEKEKLISVYENLK
ncbi:glycosyltransferase family 4 protein [Clostridium botulinum]|nr:glycosyltransferase family 4 protein [Clostridium botulinum]